MVVVQDGPSAMGWFPLELERRRPFQVLEKLKTQRILATAEQKETCAGLAHFAGTHPSVDERTLASYGTVVAELSTAIYVIAVEVEACAVLSADAKLVIACIGGQERTLPNDRKLVGSDTFSRTVFSVVETNATVNAFLREFVGLAHTLGLKILGTQTRLRYSLNSIIPRISSLTATGVAARSRSKMTEQIGNRVSVLWDREVGKFDARVGGRGGESFLMTGGQRIEFVVDVLGDLTRFVTNTRLGLSSGMVRSIRRESIAME